GGAVDGYDHEATRSAPTEPFEVIDEAGVRHGGCVHADHLHALARGESGDGAHHREAVIAEGVDLPPSQAVTTLDDEAVVGGLDVGAQAAEAVNDTGDAVCLLEAQLLRATHDGLALGEAAEQRHERE